MAANAHGFDLVAFGAHPDDVELFAGGTIAKSVAQGMRVAIVDLTRGELGTRGTAETRATEAAAARAILGVEHRENLDLGDGFFEVNEASTSSALSMASSTGLYDGSDNNPENKKSPHLLKMRGF